jgi:hypothetical protein
VSDELMQRVAALKVMSDYVKAEYDLARAEADLVMQAGDRRQVYTPDGTHIAAVSRSKPTPRAVVVDRAALTEWLSQHYPDMVESGTVVNASDREINELVFKHAPNLLKRTKSVKKDALARLQADAVRLGVPVGPSGEVDVPGLTVEMRDPVVSCLADPDSALLAVIEMVHNGRLYLDGTQPKEIEA